MHATLSGDVVRAGERARERFYDSSGYGHPVDGGSLELAPVEAAHLLYRGDLDAVEGPDGTAMDFRAFLSSAAVSEIAFLVYKDLRDRGFYLSPARADWSDSPAVRSAVDDPAVDFVVYPRGSGPWDDEVAHRVGVVSEREAVRAGDLGDLVLAVVDEESALTYLATEHRAVSGTSEADLPEGVSGELLSDRLLLWDPPAAIYDQGFYGQPLDDRDGDVIQLSLLEAAFLAREGVLDVEGGPEAVVERGRAVEGERFDRRLRVYERLRERGLVPKTGYKFGADFRTYADVESVDDLGHSELLIRVLDREHTFSPRDLALDVRLAHGVRKEMVFALVDGEDPSEDDSDGIEWLSVTRLTP
ncbi:tRNA splicing endonuclease [Halosimplex carlsbadense 2-9-1]|uniref:tRNA-splicing endonuclease n=1 Tax=Halosimplex carlsbadense 2-9-1 TaxID=797114 RepID=M0D2U7_9EURY|nr:tRNA-intron lyase [Halosimplex carlsbadense]ELZ29168.1 tRNA splicing endonuclease [Halosimplex carlsbadense 2-9-1]